MFGFLVCCWLSSASAEGYGISRVPGDKLGTEGWHCDNGKKIYNSGEKTVFGSLNKGWQSHFSEIVLPKDVFSLLPSTHISVLWQSLVPWSLCRATKVPAPALLQHVEVMVSSTPEVRTGWLSHLDKSSWIWWHRHSLRELVGAQKAK